MVLVALVVTAGLLTPAADAGATSQQPPKTSGQVSAVRLPPSTLAKVQRTIQQFKTTNHTPGVLVGIWSPEGTFVRAYGVADLTTNEPLRTDMQFKIGSQTKVFVADLILQLVGQGKVSLHDHISRWVAGVPNGSQITIRELLNHTSGLANAGVGSPAIAAKLTTGCTEQDLLAAGASEPPIAAPGTKWSYSNYGYSLLGRVVELVTKESLSEAIKQRIAKPLHLRRTLLPTTGNGLSTPLTHGYGTGDVGPTQAPSAADDATSLMASCLGAAGGMVSTLSDMRIWSRALGTGALLKPAVRKAANKGMFPFVFAGDYNGPGRWFQGLGHVETGGFIGKEGSFAGYESVTMYSPARRTTIEVVSTKQVNGITPPPMFQALAMDLYGTHLGFGLTPAQALQVNNFDSSGADTDD